MQRLYHKNDSGPWKGMNLYPHDRSDSEVLYAINRVPREGWRRRRGYDRLFNIILSDNGNMTGYNHVSAYGGSGIYDYRFPETNGENHWLILTNNQTYNGTYDPLVHPQYDYQGNVILWHNTEYGPIAIRLNVEAGLTVDCDAESRFDFRVLNGMLYGINGGKCDLFQVDYRKAPDWPNVMKYVGASYELYTTADGKDLNVYITQLPKAKVIGSFQGRLILANISADQLPTRERKSDDSIKTDTMSFADDSPRTVLLSEAITWKYPAIDANGNPAIYQQANEFFTFNTGDEQEIVAQREFSGRNVFFLSDSIWILNGERAETEYSATNIVNGIGCIAPFSIQEVHDGLIFMGTDGFYLLDRSFAIKQISDPIAPLVMEGHGTYEAPALAVDQNLVKHACSVAYHGADEYRCWLPLAEFPDSGNQLCLVYNFVTGGWTINGIAAARYPWTNTDNETINLTYKEKGMAANAACMYEDLPGRELPIWIDHDGWVNIEASHNMDAYWITRIVTPDISATAFNIRDLMGEVNIDVFKGATIVMLDDRTLTEQQDGTFTTASRIPPGTSRTISTSSVSVGVHPYTRCSFSSTWSIVPQNGAVVAIYWPIRDRLITELYTKNPETIKRLSRLQARIKARNSGTIKCKVTSQPELLNSDDVLNELPFDSEVAMSQAGDVYGPTINDFKSANQRDFNFWVHPGHDTGRKFYVMFEEYSIEDSEIYGWTSEMQSLAYR